MSDEPSGSVNQQLAKILRKLSELDDNAEAVFGALAELEVKLDAVLEGIALLKAQGEKLMALAEDLKTAIANLDTETTAVGVLITSLASRITNSMTDQDVADVKAAFGTLSDRLTVLAVDPTNPVPPPTPQFKKLKAGCP